jgi:2',3'-cyclic-nucleotide 2'-phosphodiesterase (5'-nucleotidase family)
MKITIMIYSIILFLLVRDCGCELEKISKFNNRILGKDKKSKPKEKEEKKSKPKEKEEKKEKQEKKEKEKKLKKADDFLIQNLKPEISNAFTRIVGRVSFPILKKKIIFVHFNDVYDVTKMDRFFGVIDQIKLKYTGFQIYYIFSGDILSESYITNNSPEGLKEPIYMEKVLKMFDKSNKLIMCPGNHEYDYGTKFMQKLITDTSDNAVWLLSNFKKKKEAAGKTFPNLAFSPNIFDLKNTYEFQQDGLKFCFIGVGGNSWNSGFAKIKKDAIEFQYLDPTELVRHLSLDLKKNKGCHVVSVISHMGNSEDIKILQDENGVDFIFGGHDHLYYLNKQNDKFLLKSGSDFDTFSVVEFWNDRKPQKEFLFNQLPSFEFFRDELVQQDESADKKEKQETIFKLSLDRDSHFINVIIKLKEVYPNSQPNKEVSTFVIVELAKRNFTQKPLLKTTCDLDLREPKIRNKPTGIMDFTADLAMATFGTDIACAHAGMFKSQLVISQNQYLSSVDLFKVFSGSKPQPYVIAEINLDMLKEILRISIDQKLKKFTDFYMSCSNINYTWETLKDPPLTVQIESSNGIDLPEKLKDPKGNFKIALPFEFFIQGYSKFEGLIAKYKDPTKENIETLKMFIQFSELAKAPEIAKDLETIQKNKLTLNEIREYQNVKDPAKKAALDALVKPGKGEKLEDRLQKLRLLTLVKQIATTKDKSTVFAIEPVCKERNIVNKFF